MTVLNELIENILDEPFATAASVENFQMLGNWDSLQYVKLVLELQGAYGIEFSEDEITRLLSVAGIREVLVKKGCKL